MSNDPRDGQESYTCHTWTIWCGQLTRIFKWYSVKSLGRGVESSGPVLETSPTGFQLPLISCSWARELTMGRGGKSLAWLMLRWLLELQWLQVGDRCGKVGASSSCLFVKNKQTNKQPAVIQRSIHWSLVEGRGEIFSLPGPAVLTFQSGQKHFPPLFRTFCTIN